MQCLALTNVFCNCLANFSAIMGVPALTLCDRQEVYNYLPFLTYLRPLLLPLSQDPGVLYTHRTWFPISEKREPYFFSILVLKYLCFAA